MTIGIVKGAAFRQEEELASSDRLAGVVSEKTRAAETAVATAHAADLDCGKTALPALRTRSYR
jgi:hypothetical protein